MTVRYQSLETCCMYSFGFMQGLFSCSRLRTALVQPSEFLGNSENRYLQTPSKFMNNEWKSKVVAVKL